jgi:hypothetical protein
MLSKNKSIRETAKKLLQSDAQTTINRILTQQQSPIKCLNYSTALEIFSSFVALAT